MIDEKTKADLLILSQDLERLEQQHRDALSEGFNIFKEAGLVTQEIRHSNILEFLLKPNGQHGLGDALLKQIIRKASEKSGHAEKPESKQMADINLNLNDAIVQREKKHIDILSWSENNNLVVAIENKVGASEMDGQLERYREEIRNDDRFKKYSKLFIYLTVDGDNPSDDEWWVPLSYGDVLEILEEVSKQKIGEMSEDARVFVRHYIDLDSVVTRCQARAQGSVCGLPPRMMRRFWRNA